jgi:hypothetical protein
MQGSFMNIDNIIPSILHVTAKSEVDIENDLNSSQTKSIAELISDNNNEEKKEDPEIIS